MNTQTAVSTKNATGSKARAQTNSFLSLIRLVSDESVSRCMNRLVIEENYELAILYRNELVRRKSGIRS